MDEGPDDLRDPTATHAHALLRRIEAAGVTVGLSRDGEIIWFGDLAADLARELADHAEAVADIIRHALARPLLEAMGRSLLDRLRQSDDGNLH
jgi:hypothetical protein